MLRDEIRAITGNKRKFLLLRIVDMGVDTALTLCNVKRGTYNTWCQNPTFVELYRRRDEFSSEYKQEAIQLLRRDNQLAAVLLESKLIHKMKEEIESGEYELIRTNLAKEVYSRLLSDLDIQPQVQSLTWEQRIQNLFLPQQDVPGIGQGGEAIEAEVQESSQQRFIEAAEESS